MKKKIVLTSIVALTLALLCAVGGTVAWLIDSSGDVKNTFTPSNIDIALWENTYDIDTNKLTNDKTYRGVDNYKMIPGNELPKNPTVTVAADSEPCWLFITVKEDLGSWAADDKTFTDYLYYEIADGWTLLEEGVYYREVVTSSNPQDFEIIANNKVTVSGDITKDMMDVLYVNGSTNPTLSFYAYAIQKANTGSPADAWTKINQANSTPTN